MFCVLINGTATPNPLKLGRRSTFDHKVAVWYAADGDYVVTLPLNVFAAVKDPSQTTILIRQGTLHGQILDPNVSLQTAPYGVQKVSTAAGDPALPKTTPEIIVQDEVLVDDETQRIPEEYLRVF